MPITKTDCKVLQYPVLLTFCQLDVGEAFVWKARLHDFVLIKTAQNDAVVLNDNEEGCQVGSLIKLRTPALDAAVIRVRKLFVTAELEGVCP